MREMVDFYQNKIVHPDGYTFEGILAADNDWLAVKHNYIQWLFPLKKASAAVPGSPIISQKELDEFKQDPNLQKQVLRSFGRMLQFYGFTIGKGDSGKPTVIKADDFDERKKDWLAEKNHNYKRISRILESLVLLGQRSTALMFYTALKELYAKESARIGWTTFSYWKDAVGE
jgi:hypothetical protein